MQAASIDAAHLTLEQLKALGDQVLTALRQQTETHEMLMAGFGPRRRAGWARMAFHLDCALAALSALYSQSSRDSGDDAERQALEIRLKRLHTFLVDIGICEHDNLRADSDLTGPAFITTERKYDALTPREREVLRFIVEGQSTKQVAEILGITVKTAACHRYRIMQKLDIHDTATLVRYAIRARVAQS